MIFSTLSIFILFVHITGKVSDCINDDDNNGANCFKVI